MQFRNFTSVLLALAIPAAAWAQQPQPQPEKTPDPGTVIATYGDQKLTYGDFANFLAVLPPETQAAARGPGKRQLAEELIKQRLLAAQARTRGLDKTPSFQAQMAIMADNILVGLLLRDMEATLVSDQEVQKYYNEHKADLERLTARHILVAVRPGGLSDEAAAAKAATLRKRLDAGEDFATLAGTESDDPGSKGDGGMLPRFSRGQMVPEFEKAAFDLRPGQVSAPVKTDFGYHLIKLEGRDIPTYEDARGDIADALRQQKFQQMVADMLAKAGPKLDEGFFGTPPATEPAAPAPGGLPRPEK